MKQHFNTLTTSTFDDYIQNLPFELQERIRQELISKKIKQRAALGWDSVHKELLEAPLCQECQRHVSLFGHCNYWWFWDNTQLQHLKLHTE